LFPFTFLSLVTYLTVLFIGEVLLHHKIGINSFTYTHHSRNASVWWSYINWKVANTRKNWFTEFVFRMNEIWDFCGASLRWKFIFWYSGLGYHTI
jgi:hypothetical protein